jgi:putative PEP-CTERM system TPR-repeat lipoprotein
MNIKPFLQPITLCCLLTMSNIGMSVAAVEQKDVAVLYEDALIQFQQGELATAVIHLKNVLKRDQNYLAAHLLLGQAYLQQGEGALAERELNTARRLGADQALISVPLGQAYQQQRKYRQILDGIKEGDFLPELNSEILVIRGGAHLELGEIDSADQAFAKAASYAPDAIAPLLGQVAVLMRKGEFSAIDAVMQRAIDLNPKAPDVWRTKGSVAHAQHKFAQAVDFYRKALELLPDDYKTQVAMAGAYMDMGKYDLALEQLNKLRGEQVLDPQVPYLIGVVYSRLGDAKASKEAMVEASDIMSKLPTEVKGDHLETLLLSGLIDYSLNKMDEAYASLELYVRRVPGNPGARKLMGSILFKRGQYDRAIQALKPALGQIPNDYRLLTMLGTAYLKKGRHLRAIELLDRAVALGGKAVEARTQLGLSLLAQGRGEVGLEQLGEVFAQDEEARLAGVTLVLERLKRNQNREAVTIAKLLSERNPENMNLLNLLASSEIAAGDLPAATKHLEQILKTDSGYLAAKINLAKIDLAAGRLKQTRERIEQAQKDHPGNTLVLTELARVEEASGNAKQAVELLRKVVALSESSVTANLQLGEIYLRLGMKQELNQHLQKLERLFPDDIQVMRFIGVAHLAQGNPDKARISFRRMSKAAGYNSQVLLDAAGLLRAAGDLEGATWALMKALEDSPRSVPAQIAMAEVQLVSGRQQLAAETISQMIQFHPDEPSSYRLQADLAMSKGEFPNAIAGYKKAIAMGDSNTVQQLYRAYLFFGDVRAGVAFLEEAIKNSPKGGDSNRLSKSLAEGYLRLGDLSAAGTAYEGLVDAGLKDPEVYNNLSMIRFRQGREGALDLARKAHALAPEDPAIGDTLGWILVKTGSPAKGLRYLRNANLRASTSKSIRYHIAAALVDLGRKGEAKQELESLLESGEDFTDMSDAKALLEHLKSDK